MATITFTSAGGITASSTVTATAFNATSTREKKENIENTSCEAVNLLKNVNVVDFTFKEDINKVPRIGFIAEETPSLLSTPNQDQMDMYNCIGVLIKAAQELSDRIEKLEEKING